MYIYIYIYIYVYIYIYTHTHTSIHIQYRILLDGRPAGRGSASPRLAGAAAPPRD